MISKKVIRQIIDESLMQVVDDLKIVSPAKRTKKMLIKLSKTLASQLKKELKDLAKAEKAKEKKKVSMKGKAKKSKELKKKVIAV